MKSIFSSFSGAPALLLSLVLGIGPVSGLNAAVSNAGILNPGFEEGLTDWDTAGDGPSFNAESSGGNTGAYVSINHNAGNWAVLVANDNAIIPLTEMGLTAGNTYQFFLDMKIESGSANSNIGGLKVDFFTGTNLTGSTGNIYPTLIGDGSTWQTYAFNISIAAGTDGVKIVPLWGGNSHVGYDNIAYDNSPYVPPMTTYTWSGGDGDWSTGSNWDGGVVPSLSSGNSIATIGSGAVTYDGTSNGDFQHGSGSILHIDSGASWEQTSGIAWFQVNGGQIVLDGGTFTQGTSGNMNGWSPAALEVTSNGGTLNVNGVQGINGATINGPFTYNITAGGLNLNDMSFPDDFTFSGGTLELSSSTISGDFTYNGGGILLLQSATVSGDIIFNASSNEFHMSGGNYTMTEGSTISAKLISFAGGGVLTMNGGRVNLADDSANKGAWDSAGVGKGFDFSTGSTAEIFWSHATVTVEDVNAKLADGSILLEGAVNAAAFDVVEDSGGILLSLAELASSYTITASASAGGSISPSGSVTVTTGDSQTFSITADSGYSIADVLVNGSSQGAIASYTFSNVNTANTIEANFSYQGIANSDFETASGSQWVEEDDNSAISVAFPSTGGNSGGYAQITHDSVDSTLDVGYLNSNSEQIIDIDDLSLTAGNIYNFSVDMKAESGNSVGGLRITFYNGSGENGRTSDLTYDETVSDSSWSTYTFPVYLPYGTDGIKIALVSGQDGAVVGYDNVSVSDTIVQSYASTVIPDAGFENGYAAWQDGGVQNTDFYSFSNEGVNDSGYIELDHAGGGFGVAVANNGHLLSLASLGLTAGESYEFYTDMILLGGDANGGLKVEFFTGTTYISASESRPALINEGNDWETYTHVISIPANADGIKLVLLWGDNSVVGYDNIDFSTSVLDLPAILNADFSEGSAFWTENNPGGVSFSYPTTGGNTGSYGIIDATAQTSWGGLWVANSGNIISLADLEFTAGETYEFHVDMKIESGTNLGGIKVEFFNGSAFAGATGDVRIDSTIGDGSTWETYSFKVAIPAGVDGIKLVPLNGPNSSIGYDNFGARVPVNKSITSTAGTGGSISPSGSTSVTFDGNQAYTITADSGYKVTDVVVNGVSQGAVDSYTFNGVINNSTISATFEALASSYDITASAAAGGSISPSGVTSVDYNTNQSYTITPDAGYTILDVLVDGVSVGAVATYEFTSVSSDHTISATFTNKEYLRIDFQGGYDVAGGWMALNFGGGFGPGTASATDLGDTSYDFEINNVGTWSNGFFTAGPVKDSSFTLSGLTPGQSVDLYAAEGWDGYGAAAYIVYGDNAPSGVKAQGGSNSVANPSTSDLVLIGTATANSSGEVTGNMRGRDSNFNGEGQSNGFIFAISPAPASTNNLSDWIGNYPGVGSDTAAGDDPDGDGKKNAVENILGTDPSAADSVGLSSGSKSGSTFTLTHPQNATPADDLTAAYEWSTNLTQFYADGESDGSTTVSFNAATDSGTTTVTATITGTDPGKLFVRLKVTQ